MAGTVVAVGDRVSGHNDLHQNGTLAEYVIFPAYSLARVPAEVSFKTATALLCGAMTAHQALFCKLNLTGKKTILIYAGAGGGGSIALQLAKLKHLEVLTTVLPFEKL